MDQDEQKSPETPKTQKIHQYNLHFLQQESIKRLYQNRIDEKLINLQQNEDDIGNFSITREIHEPAFEALGQWEKNIRNNMEWWNDELKALRI